MSDTATTYRVDIAHPGLRLVSLVTGLIGVLLGSLVIMPAITRMPGIGETPDVLLACIGGPAIGFGAGWAMERFLRGVWPSGRWLEVSEEAVTLRERSGEAIRIEWAEAVEVLSWHFVIRGGRMWISRGWYCVACRIVQGDRTITPYAFMKPTDAQAMAQWEAFPELISRKQDARPGTGYRAQPAVGQEQLWEAEGDRWRSGGEMTPADFTALISEIDRQVATWPG